MRRGWTQLELARRARVSAGLVSMVERGKAERVTLVRLLRVADALDGRIDLVFRWQGGDLDRLLNRRHSAMHEAIARLFARVGGWQLVPEVSYAIYGERGVIDILAWHSETRTLLVIELKTEVVDIQELIGKTDQKKRLAGRIAIERGWDCRHVAVWVVIGESRLNRRRVGAHRLTLRAAFPSDGRRMAGWLWEPTTPISALSFLSNDKRTGLMTEFASRRRVRKRRPCTGVRSHPAQSSTER